jgi:hypothetical protein
MTRPRLIALYGFSHGCLGTVASTLWLFWARSGHQVMFPAPWVVFVVIMVHSIPLLLIQSSHSAGRQPGLFRPTLGRVLAARGMLFAASGTLLGLLVYVWASTRESGQQETLAHQALASVFLVINADILAEWSIGPGVVWHRWGKQAAQTRS